MCATGVCVCVFFSVILAAKMWLDQERYHVYPVNLPIVMKSLSSYHNHDLKLVLSLILCSCNTPCDGDEIYVS
jgi:hypothetical protein